MINTPLCFFPTTTVLVDNDPQILEDMCKLLKAQGLLVESFHCPEEALKFINESNKTDTLIRRTKELAREGQSKKNSDEKGLFSWFRNSGNESSVHRAYYKLFFEPNTHRHISAVVTGFMMPEMTGIELCEKLRHLSAQKLLHTFMPLTIEIQNAIRVRTIDKYLEKDLSFYRLAQSVRAAQNKYFCDMFGVFDADLVGKMKLARCREYYSHEKPGSFVLDEV